MGIQAEGKNGIYICFPEVVIHLKFHTLLEVSDFE